MQIKSIWFTNMSDTIGIVLKTDDWAERAYIGVASSRTFGCDLDKEADELRILKTGAKFPVDVAKKLMGVS